MITKEDLKAYISDKRNADDLKGRIEEIEARLYDPRRAVLSGMPMARSSGSCSALEMAVEEYSEALDALRLHYIEQRTIITNRLLRIERELSRLPSKYQQIIRLHYIDGLTLDDTADECFISRRHLTNMHNKALKLLSCTAAEA
jgi:DNA-directed RNA polymerase specialized sigma subunit